MAITYVYRKDLEGRYPVDSEKLETDAATGELKTVDWYESNGYTTDYKSLGKGEDGKGNTVQGSTSKSSTSTPERTIDNQGNKIIKSVDEYLAMNPELKGRKGARDLVQVFIDKWIETGSQNQANDAMYASPLLETVFPGILDSEGVPAYTISAYIAEDRNYNVALAEAGLNPFLPILQERKAELFRNQIDSVEFAGRLNEIRNNLIDNPNKDAALNVYNDYFQGQGLPIEMTDEALFLLAISPEAGTQLLARNFDIADIGVSASLSGFNISKGIALDLYDRGYRRNEAEELFGQAAIAMKQAIETQAAAEGVDISGTLSIQDYLSAFVDFDADAMATFTRIAAIGKSMSSPNVGALSTQTGEVTGLVEE